MNNPGKFLHEIIVFDADNIPGDALKNVQPLIDQPFFNFQTMKGKSTAAAHLTKWVVNIVLYNKIYKKVQEIKTEAKLEEVAHAPANFALVLSGHHDHPDCNGRYTFDGYENGRPKWSKKAG